MNPTLPAASVAMPDGSTYPLVTLITEGRGNHKLGKSDSADLGYLTVGLTLAPARSAGVGNLCPHASPGCVAGCLNTAGRSAIWPSIHRARIARTRLYFRDRPGFLSMLYRDLTRARARAERAGRRLACRLNVLSDIDWARKHPRLFSDFGDVQFYDYTKDFARLSRPVPGNYHLTFSRSESNEARAIEALRLGFNVAVVFGGEPFPRRWKGFPVISGEHTDLRFLDPPRSVVALTAKGKARADRSGFVVRSPADLRRETAVSPH